MSESQGVDISQQTAMWHRFTRVMQIGVAVTAVVLILLASFLL